MAAEHSYIIAGSLIWLLIFSLTAFVASRYIREIRTRRRILQAEEREARDIARRFAEADHTQAESDSFTSIELGDGRQNRADSDVLQRQRALHVSGLSRPTVRPPQTLSFEIQGYMLRDGLSREEINAYAPMSLHRKRDLCRSADGKNSTAANLPLTCAVCLENIELDSRKRVLPCEHSFHARCVQLWLQRANRCPCCVAPVVKKRDIATEIVATSTMDSDLSLPLSQTRGDSTTSTSVGRVNGSRFLGLWTFGRASESGYSQDVDAPLGNESDDSRLQVETIDDNSFSMDEAYIRSTDDRFVDVQEAGMSVQQATTTLRALHRSIGIDSMVTAGN